MTLNKTTLRTLLVSAIFGVLATVAGAQWTVTSTSPKEPPYTDIHETNPQGDTRDTHYERAKDGRVTRMNEIRKRKNGSVYYTLNEWFDDHGNIIDGNKHEYGPPDEEWTWDKRRKGWVTKAINNPNPKGDSLPYYKTIRVRVVEPVRTIEVRRIELIKPVQFKETPKPVKNQG